ncbi:O-antigen polymerase [Dyadobacter luticola]|uniref:Oligosaccharide repeat unit polymerase n=1 Tax=Dyadobacter luticola TaxID=1979387 RepID=A0A5R9L1V4_9BACT|nr:O-antigen polymerase [Dyadobacter luticola]TLV02388.1 oligosaccharide repeat unit polymerase [Dyadobacter luticola]
MRDPQELAVWINLLLYCCLFLGFQLWARSVRLGSLALFIYAVSSIFGLVFFNSVLSNFSNLKIFPAIFLFVLFLIVVYPIIRFDTSKLWRITFNYNVVYWLSMVIGAISILPAIEVTFLLTKVSQMDQSIFAEIHRLKNEGEGTIDTLQLSGISKIMYVLISRFSDVTPILLFLQLASRKKDWKVIIALLIPIYCVNAMGVVQAGRSTLTYTVVYFLALYLIFKDFLPLNAKKAVRRYGIILLSLVVGIFLFITFARYNQKSVAADVPVIEWISLYAGEGTLYFNEFVWNMRGTTNGDYIFAYFKDLLDFKAFTDVVERRDYWVLKTNIPQHVFYTFIGAVIEDLGKTGGAVFLIFISFLITRATNLARRFLTLSNIIILCIWCKIVISGITFYAYGGHNKTELLIVDLVFALVCVFYRNDASILNKTIETLKAPKGQKRPEVIQ